MLRMQLVRGYHNQSYSNMSSHDNGNSAIYALQGTQPCAMKPGLSFLLLTLPISLLGVRIDENGGLLPFRRSSLFAVRVLVALVTMYVFVTNIFPFHMY